MFALRTASGLVDVQCLVLRCSNGDWAAFGSAVSAYGTTLHCCRQAVSRCRATGITQPGWHCWETNYDANSTDAGLVADWHGELWAGAQVP